MSLIQTGKTFSDGEQLTAAKLNQIVGDATLSTSGVDGSTITINENDALAVRTGGIGTSSLANSSVTADKIATDAVTADKIANDAVTREKINDFAVDTDRLATDAVTNAKIADLAVGTAEIQANAVNLSKIADANLATAADNGTTMPDNDSKLPTAKLVKDSTDTLRMGTGWTTLMSQSYVLELANNFPQTTTNAGVVMVILERRTASGYPYDSGIIAEGITFNYLDGTLSSSRDTFIFTHPVPANTSFEPFGPNTNVFNATVLFKSLG